MRRCLSKKVYARHTTTVERQRPVTIAKKKTKPDLTLVLSRQTVLSYDLHTVTLSQNCSNCNSKCLL